MVHSVETTVITVVLSHPKKELLKKGGIGAGSVSLFLLIFYLLFYVELSFKSLCCTLEVCTVNNTQISPTQFKGNSLIY